MKGLVFNQLQEFVESNHGILAWDKAITSCDLESEGIYVATKTYTDNELNQLVTHFSNELKVSPNDLVRSFGEFMFESLLTMAPETAQKATNLKVFLVMVEELIHVEVKKLDQTTNLPEFQYQDEGELFIMIYSSPRKLCYLSEGLILGAARHFNEKVAISQSTCMHKGDDFCTIEIKFL